MSLTYPEVALQPSSAEIARTLAAGRLPGTAQVACHPGPLRLRHAADPAGRPLLLVRSGGSVSEALRPAEYTDDTAVAVRVEDNPPVPGAPSLGTVFVAGWAAPLTGTEAHAAALDFAAANPASDLLDVGRGYTLYRVDVAEVRLERNGDTEQVDPDDYAAATPDPLHELERDLLTDLAAHHAADIGTFIRRQLADAGRVDRSSRAPRVVRLDRYGMVIEAGDPGRTYRARLAFPHPITDRAHLSHLLHPVLCPRCPTI